MNIETKFNCGDVVFTIDVRTLKRKKFRVGAINAYMEKDGKTSVYLSPEDDTSYRSYKESLCFGSEDELKKYVFG